MPPRTPTPAPDAASSPHSADPPLHWIRGHRVILDADLAALYGVPTYRFNEAFKRNQARFPEDFAFQLTAEEARNLRSQIAISSLPFVTENSEYGGRRYLPWVFTEHGAVMAANLLKSEQAVRVSVFVVRAFVRMREQIAANQAILQRLAEIDSALLEHDSALRDIYDKLLLMLEPFDEPSDPPPRRPMGFHRDG
jgi:hypothetical protein